MPSLEAKAIKKWGNSVQGYGTSYGEYDRNRISVEVRERINFRWISNLGAGFLCAAAKSILWENFCWEHMPAFYG